MQTFHFTIYVKETDITEKQASALYELGDIVCGVDCGEGYVCFDRLGTFEEPTIDKALQQVKRVGLTPSRVVDDSGLNERKY
jgi:hypothetical protein